MTLRSALCLLALCAAAPWLAAEGEEPLQPVVDRVVIFAPVAVGNLTDRYPQAASDLANGMASRLTLRVAGVRANFSETLPASDAAAWSEGVQGLTSGAHLTVLTVIEEYAVKTAPPGINTGEQMMARVHVRGLDATGNQVWHKADVIAVPNREDPKNRHIGGPQGQVAWEACNAVLTSLAYWLTQTAGDDLKLRVTASGEPMPDAAQLIDVQIDSDPPGADILVNGVFRGTTPMTVPLPQLEIELRLQRQGHQPWTNRMTPAADMQIKPGLERE